MSEEPQCLWLRQRGQEVEKRCRKVAHGRVEEQDRQGRNALLCWDKTRFQSVEWCCSSASRGCIAELDGFEKNGKCSHRREASKGKRLVGNVNPSQLPHFVHLVVSDVDDGEPSKRDGIYICGPPWHPGTMLCHGRPIYSPTPGDCSPICQRPFHIHPNIHYVKART